MKKLFILICPVILLVSCAKDKEDFNIDQKRADEAPPATLFTNAVKELSDALTTPNVNSNVFRFYVQYWTATEYLDEPRYNLTSRTIPQALWQSMYRDVLRDLMEARILLEEDEFIPEEVKNNQLGQIGILEVYAWSVLVNTFGDVPYSEALDIDNPEPAYDDAETVYNDILNKLDASLALLDPEHEGFEEGDLLYNYGNVTSGIAGWARFGNSLKLKLGMILADTDEGTAREMIEEAAPNVFESNADNARFPYMETPPNHNPVADNLNPLFTSRQDYVAASAFVDLMNDLEDPRRPFYFTEVNGEYRGGRYGFTNTYDNFSTASDMVTAPDFEALLLDYSEVEFLLAEAVERGFNVGGTAAGHYENAIRASILYWGGSEADATVYLANPEVAYLTASGDYEEKIGMQKWIALYNRGYDAWLEWKRLDYPQLSPPSGSGAPSGLEIPVRLIYPINEHTLNGANREAAASAIGGDEATTRLFWDVN